MNNQNINGILLIYKYPPGPKNLIDHVNAFDKFSRYKVWGVNALGGFPKNLDSLRFSTIVLHYSFLYTINYSNPISSQYMEYIRKCDSSYKIAFFQDEHHSCQRRFKFINECKIDCIYTLLELEGACQVYGKNTNVKKIISTLPCFVDPTYLNGFHTFSGNKDLRSVDIGYRGRELPVYMGKGALEKSEISFKFKQACEGMNLKLDIETGEQHRIYGRKWNEFIVDCKAMLGVEAGVSIFDIEDTVKKEYDRLSLIPDKSEREHEINKYLDQWEDNIYYRTMSPRQFEMAAFHTCQILYTGKYSNVVKPMVHYIPLEKDFSNFDEVIRMFRDEQFRKELTDNAYRDLIASGNYGYDQFIGKFDDELAKEGIEHKAEQKHVDRVTELLNKDIFARNMKARLKMPLYRYFPGRELMKSLAVKIFEMKKSTK